MKTICSDMYLIRLIRFVFIAVIIISSSFNVSVAGNNKEFLLDHKVRSFLQLVPEKRSSEFKISAGQLKEVRQDGNDFVFVDVRRSDEYEVVKIAGSLNISLHSIKTKHFLKTRKVVLVNNGANYFTLEQECRKIKQLGFPYIKILSGGIAAWKDAGGSIVGDLVALEKTNEIKPIEYFVDRNYDDWIIINLSKNSAFGEEHLFPTAFKAEQDEFTEELNRIIEQKPDNEPPYVLIVDEDGLDYGPVKHTIQKAGLVNVFYLHGGLRGYQDFLQKQSLIWNPKKETTSTCATCPL